MIIDHEHMGVCSLARAHTLLFSLPGMFTMALPRPLLYERSSFTREMSPPAAARRRVVSPADVCVSRWAPRSSNSFTCTATLLSAGAGAGAEAAPLGFLPLVTSLVTMEPPLPPDRLSALVSSLGLGVGLGLGLGFDLDLHELALASPLLMIWGTNNQVGH